MDMPMPRKVAILCSGFGLGFYVPGLLIRDKLRRLGIQANLEVFESLLPEAKILMVERNRRAYHESFQVALTSQKVPTDTRTSIDALAMESLLAKWKTEDCRDFICISGHWVNVLDAYRAVRSDKSIRADLLYLDVELSPSWKWLHKLRPEYAKGYNEVRFYDPAQMDVRYSIDMNMEQPLPFEARQKRLVVHGGGWGIGTYQQRIPDLEAAGYGLDIACYARTEAVSGLSTRRYFMDDPAWRTWHRDAEGEHTFAPFDEVTLAGPDKFEPQRRCHGIYRVMRSALGIVSKAGAGTLIDSFGSATPLIMLEPFGPHEQRNAQVWLAARFGVPYHVWAYAGYPDSMLQELHHNLLTRRQEVKDYAEDYAQRLLAAGSEEEGTRDLLSA